VGEGEILANIWLTNRIARIDPKTGKVKGWIDVGLLPEALHRTDPSRSPMASPMTPSTTGCSSPARTGRISMRSGSMRGPYNNVRPPCGIQRS